MAIYLYTGTPGSGKSFHMAKGIYLRSQYGHFSICNFEVNTDNIKKYKGGYVYFPNSELTPRALIQFALQHRGRRARFKEGQFVLYIDEAGIFFNSRDWNSPMRKEWLEFFAQHRKYGYTIVLAAQFDRQIDRQIRECVEYEMIHRKINNFGKFGKVAGIFFGGTVFICIQVWRQVRQKISTEWIRYNKRVASIYDTFKIFDSQDNAT